MKDTKTSEEQKEDQKEEKDEKEPHHSKLKSKPSLHYKNSFNRLSSEGSMNRPIHRIASTEKDKGMTDKLHSLMEEYIPRDVPSIQKA